MRRQTPGLRRVRQRRGRAGITRAFSGPVRDADYIHHRLRLSRIAIASFRPPPVAVRLHLPHNLAPNSRRQFEARSWPLFPRRHYASILIMLW